MTIRPPCFPAALCLICLAVFPASAAGQGAVGALRRLLESGRVPAERQGAIVEMICERGDADDLAFVFALVGKPDALQPAVRRNVVELLTDAATTRHVQPSGDLSGLITLIEREAAGADYRLQIAAIRLAAAWKLSAATRALQALALHDQANENLRCAALDALVAIGGASSQPTLERLAQRGVSAKIRVAAVAALARTDLVAGSALAAEILAESDPATDVGPLLDSLLGRREGAEQLAQALARQPPSADTAKRALRHMYSVGRSDQALSDLLSKAAGIALDAPPPAQAEVARIAALVSQQGDAARGEQVFRRGDLSCQKCHAVSQAGGSVGPDLSPVGAMSPVDYIVNSILNPNLAVKEQFVTRRVLTANGEVFTGILVDRDDQKLRLRDAAGKLQVIPTDVIEQEGEGPSLMPQGLTKFLTQQEFLDLARFVAELGKPGPYALRQSPGIQRWRVLQNPGAALTSDVPDSELLRGQVLEAPAEAWTTAYAMVGGRLPLAEMTRQRPAVLYLQGEFQVTQAGAVALEIACSEPRHAWIGAEPFVNPTRIERLFPAGKQVVTLRIPLGPAVVEPSLQVDISRPMGSTAQVQAVNGM
jgi:putative heme-binding domain-containing protein